MAVGDLDVWSVEPSHVQCNESRSTSMTFVVDIVDSIQRHERDNEQSDRPTLFRRMRRSDNGVGRTQPQQRADSSFCRA